MIVNNKTVEKATDIIEHANFWDALLDCGNERIFLYPFRLLIMIAHNKISKQYEHHENLDNLEEILVSDLINIVDLVKRPLVWEFHLVNRKEMKTSIKLFLQSISSENQMKIFFKKYPVVELILNRVITNYTDKICLFINRVKNDFIDISDAFGLKNYKLKSFSSEGDSHANGSRVIVASFVNDISNEKRKLVYKPRSVRMEVEFQKYIAFLNDFVDIKLKTIKVIDKGSYGWVSFVEHKAVSRRFEGDFYYRFGILAGIVYSLNGLDMHYENVIACAEHPHIIDMECLFSVPINLDKIANLSYPSLHETTMIPTEKIGEENAFDFSPLLNHSKQTSPVSRYRVKFISEYELKIEKKLVNIKPAHNYLIKEHSGAAVNPLRYVKKINQGYTDYINFVIKNKRKVVKFIMDSFSDVKQRIIFKPTYLYCMVISESYHPKLLSSIKDYLGYFDGLKKWSKTEFSCYIVEHEISDVLNGDIPYFSSMTSSKLIKNSNGDRIKLDQYESGIARSINRINSMSRYDIEKGIKLITSSIRSHYAK